jgi:outer membrane protein
MTLWPSVRASVSGMRLAATWAVASAMLVGTPPAAAAQPDGRTAVERAPGRVELPGGLLDQPAAAAPPVIRLTVEDAVHMALEANLGLQAERLAPLIQDAQVAQARAVWTPTLLTQVSRADNASPPDSFLAGAAPTITDLSVATVTGLSQQLPWYGGRYDVRWSASRGETTAFTSFNPRLRSQLLVQFTQPLVRDFRIDGGRRQVWTSENLRAIADLGLRQTLVATTRSVRHAYWDLVSAIAAHRVAQQSLDLAREALRNNRTRVEVGTMAPIDIVEAEAEVARNEEAVIVAEQNIRRAQDALRTLILSPDRADFWTVAFDPVEQPELRAQPVDVEAAVRRALDERTDILAAKKALDNTRLSESFYRNQRLPNVDLNLTYTAVGLGGTEFKFDYSGGFPPPIVGQARRGFGSVLSDVLTSDYASWSIALVVGYPLGTSAADAALAAARLQHTQQETHLRNLELTVAASVRDVARQVETNRKRVEVTQKARELAERRLEAEQKKFSVGMSDTFRVLQAQRDLAVARNAELRAIIDYNKSLVDFETVQQAPLGGR